MLRAGFLSEAAAVDDHDVFLADQFFHEDFVAFGDVDAGEGVEGAARGDAAYARRGFTPLLREIAAGAQFAAHFGEMILRAFERGLDRVLLGMIGAQARAQPAGNAFKVGVDGSGVAGGNAPADAPSRDETG